MSDIRDVLQNRTTNLAQTLRDADEFDAAGARRTVKRKRVVRAAVTSTAAVVGVLAIGSAALAGYGAWNQTPAASPTPSTTPSGSPSATPSPIASPSVTPSPSNTPEPEHAIVSGADAEILERLENPTTGETWHEPEAIESLGLKSTEDFPDTDRYFSVGSRGDATIIVTTTESFYVFEGGFPITGLYEVDGDGVRFIACPTTRDSDWCMDTDRAPAGTVVDTETHYDSLTYPFEVSPLAGWTFTTIPNYSGGQASDAFFGTANRFPGNAADSATETLFSFSDRVVLAGLGDSALVELRGPGDVPGTTGARHAFETPFGSLIDLGDSARDWYGHGLVTWDDGVDSFEAPHDIGEGLASWPVAPADRTCFASNEVLLDNFDASDWRPMGRHAMGLTVYLPAQGGNDVAKATWEWMRDNSFGEEIEPDLAYPYDTYEEFLDARSVFTWQRPDGEWALAISAEAGQRVYECA